jgi:hypothetical protein
MAMAVGSRGHLLVLNETGFGMLGGDGEWTEVELDRALQSYWSELLWLSERQLLFMGMFEMYFGMIECGEE